MRGSYEQALADQRAAAAAAGQPVDEAGIRTKALYYALGNGLLNAAVEIGGGIQKLPQELQQGTKAWKALVSSAVDEGKEEVIQGIIERAMQNVVYDKKNPLVSVRDPEAIFNPVTSAREWGGGAFVGGLLGAGQIGISGALNAAARRGGDGNAPGELPGFSAYRDNGTMDSGAADPLMQDARRFGGAAEQEPTPVRQDNGTDAEPLTEDTAQSGDLLEQEAKRLFGRLKAEAQEAAPQIDQSAPKAQEAGDAEQTVTENPFLTEADLTDYMQVGSRKHVRDLKLGQLLKGKSPILTSIEQVKSFIRSALSGNIRDTIKAYGRVGSRLSGDIHNAAGVDVSDYYLELDSNRMRHLTDHILDDGDGRNMPLTQEQAENITNYIDSYDDVLDTLKRKDGSIRVTLGKRINGHAVVLVLVSRGRQSLQPVTAWQNTTEHYLKRYGNKKAQPIDASQLQEGAKRGYKPAVQEAAEAASDANISQSDPEVKSGAEAQAETGDLLEQKVQRLFGQEQAETEAETETGGEAEGQTGSAETELDPLMEDAGRQEARNTSEVERTGVSTSQDPASRGEMKYDILEAAAIRQEGKTYRNLVAGLDSSVSAFFNKWKNGRNHVQGEKLEKLYLGKISDNMRQQISDILGYEIDGRDVIITNDDVRHIFESHGDAKAETERGNIPLEDWTFDALPEVVTDPDSISPGELTPGGKHPGKRGIIFKKTFENGTIITIQFDNKRRGTIEVTTMFANKNSGKPTQALDVEDSSPQLTSETVPGPVGPTADVLLGGGRPPLSVASPGASSSMFMPIVTQDAQTVNPGAEAQAETGDLLEQKVQRLFGQEQAEAETGEAGAEAEGQTGSAETAPDPLMEDAGRQEARAEQEMGKPVTDPLIADAGRLTASQEQSLNSGVKLALTSQENMERYRADIDKVFTGEFPSGKIIRLGETPDILQQYGAKPHTLTMKQDTAYKIAYPEGYFGGKHNLGMSVLKQLPYQLENPVAILKSNTQSDSLVVLTEWMDGSKSIIIPVHLDKTGAIELENRVASAYKIRRMQGYLGDHDQNVLYTKNGEDIHQLLSKGVQFPQAMADDVLAGNSIPLSDREVNPGTETKTETGDLLEQEVQRLFGQEAGTPKKPRISMENFVNTGSPVWNYVAYDDTATQDSITQTVHREMMASGQSVQIPETTTQRTAEAYPDLRTMKKADRIPIMKQKMNALKDSLRQFLDGLKGTSFDFEVNGNILEARLYNAGIQEVLSKITQDKASMLFHSDEIFRNARYLYSTDSYDGNPNIYRWNYFYTPVQVGDQILGVRIAVRDMVKGTNLKPESQIYNLGIKKDVLLDGGRRGPKVASPDVSSSTSMPIITQDA